MTVPMIKSIGDVPYPIDTHSDVFSPLLTVGAALGITGDGTDSAEWLQRVSTSDGPTTIRGIHGNTIVQDGELVSVQMEGIETVGFNQLDPANVRTDIFINGATGKVGAAPWAQTAIVEVFPNTDYCLTYTGGNRCIIAGIDSMTPAVDDDARVIFADGDTRVSPKVFNTGDNRYIAAYIATSAAPASDICINLSWSGRRNGEYEPYWSAQREIAAATYFPDGMRSAGGVRDELTSTEAITRIGEVDLGTLTWTYTSGNNSRLTANLTDALVPESGYVKADILCVPYETDTTTDIYNHTTDKVIALHTAQQALWVYDTDYTDAATFKAAMSGVMLHYALATPTVTPIDPPLNMTYRTAAGGTERVMVPTGELSAPPTLVTAGGYTAESLRDAALATIAPVENGIASTNYGVGAYLVHGGQLCKVTTAIASGEAIAIGTNVTATTVMAEIIALTQ